MCTLAAFTPVHPIWWQVPLLLAAATSLYNSVVTMAPEIFQQIDKVPVELGELQLKKLQALHANFKQHCQFVHPGEI
jgi:hypothetical protein